jgi:hypothetical protein
MATAVPAQTSDADERLIWDAILRQTDSALKSNTDPNVWAVQITSTLRSSAVTLPSVDLAHRLVSHLFWNNHSPTAWKLLHTAASLDIIPPLLLLALLSTRSFHISVSFSLFRFFYVIYCVYATEIRF